MNRVGDKEFEMSAGDTVAIPEGTRHNERNIGKEDAVLSISYNSADRIAEKNDDTYSELSCPVPPVHIGRPERQ